MRTLGLACAVVVAILLVWQVFLSVGDGNGPEAM